MLHTFGRRLAGLLLAVTIAGAVAACGNETVNPTATPIGRGGSGTPGGGVQSPQNDRQVTVIVTGGEFNEKRYTARTGSQIELIVTTRGGPYTMTIDGVGQSYVLQEQGTNFFSFDPPPPGDYKMRLNSGGTATLTIRQ